MTTTKRKRVSKKSKKSWRKHCDIRDVEEFLEDQRLEERLGKFSAKDDSELFVVDTGPTEPSPEPAPYLTAKARKRQQLSSTPKCYEVLLTTSKVPDPNAKRNVVNPPGTKPTALSKLTDKRNLARGVCQRKLESIKINRALEAAKKKRIRESRGTFQTNLWTADAEEAKGVPESLQSEWVSPEAVRHHVALAARGRPARKAAARHAPAVAAPHPGNSYNPAYEDHQALLRAVVEAEQKLMKREAHIQRVTAAMFRRLRPDQLQTQWMEEMMQGLPEVRGAGVEGAEGGAAAAAEEEEESEGEYRAVNAAVRVRRKDTAARNRQRRQLQERERLKKAKQEKKKIADIYKLRFLSAALERAEARLARVRELSRLSKERRRRAPPTLNAHRRRAPDLPYAAPGDLPPHLRALAPDQTLLRDRFESLQQRGALAPSRIFFRKKLKLKSYFKSGHKVTHHDVDRVLAAQDN